MPLIWACLKKLAIRSLESSILREMLEAAYLLQLLGQSSRIARYFTKIGWRIICRLETRSLRSDSTRLQVHTAAVRQGPRWPADRFTVSSIDKLRSWDMRMSIVCCAGWRWGWSYAHFC